MQSNSSEINVMRDLENKTGIIDYMRRHGMLDHRNYEYLAEQIDTVTLLLDQTEADLNDKILTLSICFIQKVLDSLAEKKDAREEGGAALDYFESNALFQAFVNYLDMLLIKKSKPSLSPARGTQGGQPGPEGERVLRVCPGREDRAGQPAEGGNSSSALHVCPAAVS